MWCWQSGNTTVMRKPCDLPNLKKGMTVVCQARGASISETVGSLQCSYVLQWWKYQEWTNGTVSMTRGANYRTPRTTDSRGEHQLPMVGTDWLALYCWSTGHQINCGVTRCISNTKVQWTLLCISLQSRCLQPCWWLITLHNVLSLHSSINIRPLPTGNGSQVSYIFTSWTGVGISCKKPPRTKHPETTPGRTHLQHYSLGTFSRHCLGLLVPLKGTHSCHGYLFFTAYQVCAYILTDHVSQCYVEIGNCCLMFPMFDGIFQQNSATWHTAWITCACFEDHQKDFQLLPWAPNSPDLYLIENLWVNLD